MSTQSSSRGKGEVIAVEFRPAKGGATSETHMKYKRGGQGGGPMEDHEREMAVHATKEDAHKHLDKMMGDCWSKQDGDKEAEKE